MKKLVLFSFLLGSAFAAIAQPGPARIGLKAGLNLSNYLGKTSKLTDWRNQTGVNGGLVVNIPLSATVFSLQPELLYSMKGAGYNYRNSEELEFKEYYTTRQNYLELPVMANFKTRWVYFEFGPVASVLLNAEVEVAPEAKHLLGTGGDATKSYRSWNIGGAIGAGAVLGKNARLGIRYVADFTELPSTSKQNVQTVAWQKGFYNSVIQISGIWLFGGKSASE